MKKALYRAVLTLVIFFMVSYYTQEAETPSETFYVVGNYIITEREGRYQAQNGSTISPWMDSMYKSIITARENKFGNNKTV